MDPEVVAALVTAAVSLVVAGSTVLLARSNARLVGGLQKEVDRQRAVVENDLAERRAASDARRSYEYDALKRVYAQCEPLLFQAGELTEYAMRRIAGLAWAAREGRIRPDGEGWLADRDHYYFRSTVYAVMAPLTTAKILQRRLTTVDLSLEPRLQMQYELLKAASSSFAEDVRLARREPELPYDPDLADPGRPDRGRHLVKEPTRYRRQGLYRGTLDIVIEKLVHDTENRCKSFGEFHEEWRDPMSTLSRESLELTALFTGFHPREQPVLWRCLVAQYLLYDLFLRVQRQPGVREVQELVGGPDDVLARLDWRSPGDGCDDVAVRQPFEVGCAYVRDIARTAQDHVVGR
jgi:hypothetical protein